MEKIKLNKANIELDLAQLTFSLNVGNGAIACPGVTEFYQNTILTETNREMFLNVPGNKNSKRIPILTTGRVTKEFSCKFENGDINLDAKEVKVDKMAVTKSICINEVEDSFLVDEMVKGENNEVNPQAFLSYIWAEIAKQASADMEYLRWHGDKTSVDDFIKLTNGYLALIGDNFALVNKASYAAITPSNVVDQLFATIEKVPAAERIKANELSIFVASNVAMAFALAASKGNTMAYVTGDMGDMFLGKYKIVEVVDLDDDMIIVGPKKDFIYTYDAVDKNFVTADLTHTFGEPIVRFRVNMYYGFDIYDYTHIAYHGPVLS